MSELLVEGENVSVEFEDNGSTRTMHGVFLSEDEIWVCIRGTVGENINKEILFSKSRIVMITKN